MLRVVSLLPAATEIACAVGARDLLVGRSHECDYPPEVERLPVVSRPTLDFGGRSPSEIDDAVAAQLRSGDTLYVIDEHLLSELAPDVILTQDLCQVCAPSGNELSRALARLPSAPRIVWLSPRTLAEIDDNVLAVGDALCRRAEAQAVVREGADRLARVTQAVRGAKQRRVAFVEWTDPSYCAGHWVPEMITLAGGDDPLGRAGADSVRVSWEDVCATEPEIVVVAPCGYGLAGAAAIAGAMPRIGGARTVAVDANAYFARPGPRIVEGVELLAALLHPDAFAWQHSHQPWVEVA